MNFRQQDIMPSIGIPFEYDPFDRELFANKLNEIIKTTSGITIFLHSPWGHGKTTFIRQWQQSLHKTSEVQIAVLDAFSKDYIDDPFLLFMAEIKDLIDSVVLDEEDEEAKARTEKMKAAWKTTKQVGAKVAIGAVKQAIKRGVGDAFEDKGESGQIAEDIGEGALEQVGEYLDSKIKALTEQANTIRAFRQGLEEVATEFKEKNNGFPLTIVIDELDRCRPDFALSLLEKMKHLFDVKGVCFVIATDRDKLSQHVAHAYGLKSNDLGYITKFGDMFCTLPTQPFGQEKSLDGYIKFIRLWSTLLTGDNKNALKNNYLVMPLAVLVTANQSSMRNVIIMLKKIYFKVGSLSLMGNTDHYTALAVIAFMSVEHPDELYNILNNQTIKKSQEHWEELLHVRLIKGDSLDAAGNAVEDTKRAIRKVVNAIFGTKDDGYIQSPNDEGEIKAQRLIIHGIIEDFEYLVKTKP